MKPLGADAGFLFDVAYAGSKGTKLPVNIQFNQLPDSALALGDTLDVDVFSPPREDWINKTDDYLRRPDGKTVGRKNGKKI